jgi:eukaryotic-like serine/threonine-protein kinase
MPLAAGVRLGPYEIVASIGAGGMGEVWRARDPRLGRDVAVKVLSAAIEATPDRRRRFEQEALAAGALNHPNVLSVFDVGHYDGAPYLVFELLEGMTLRDRLQSGPLAPRRAAHAAAQAARGLAAAHDKGIVHRDLKPENLFVLTDGRIKVLDFGLAKLGPQGDEPLDSALDTASCLTQPGTLLGTVAYMAPEQVQGKAADTRSDVFSLGVVLYEMLTGGRPWVRETAAETMTAILNDDAPDLSSQAMPVPPLLERIVRRCLEKEPEARFRSAHDLAFALESLGDAPSTPSARALPPPGGHRLWRAALAAGLLAAGLAGFALGRRDARPAAADFEPVTFRRGTVVSARFGSDPETIVYSAAWEGAPVEVFATQRGQAESRPLGFAPASLLALSSKGELALALEPRWILSFMRPGLLARVPFAGGGLRRLLADVNAADWSPDGRELAAARSVPTGMQVEFPLGKVVYKTGKNIGSLRVSPDGTRLAFIEYDGDARVMLLEGDRARVLSAGWLSAGGGLAWSGSGREVWFTLGKGPPQRFDLSVVDLQGHERLVLRVPGGAWLQDVSPDGRVLLTHNSLRWQLRAGEASTSREQDLSWFRNSYVCDISADGRQVVFTDQTDLYIRDRDGNPAVRLGSGFDGGSLSPDGSRVATRRISDDRLVLLPTREGETVELPQDPTAPLKGYSTIRWMPDARRVLIAAIGQPGARIFLQDTAGGPAHPVSPPGSSDPVPSPDGRRFAAIDAEGRIVVHGLDGIALVSVPGEHPRLHLLRWTADGRALYSYRIGDWPGRLLRVDLQTGAEETARTLMPPDPAGVWRIHPVVVTADGNHYAYSVIQNLSDLYVYSGLR